MNNLQRHVKKICRVEKIIIIRYLIPDLRDYGVGTVSKMYCNFLHHVLSFVVRPRSVQSYFHSNFNFIQ